MKKLVLSLLEMYKKAIDEDAMVSAGANGGGEVVSGSTPSGDVVTNNQDGMTTDEILGTCDHHKDGYLGAKCFHVPSKAAKKIKKRIPTTDYKF